MRESGDELQKSEIAASPMLVYESIRIALTDARSRAFIAVNSAMVNAYWEIGYKINEAVGERADYGKHLLQFLSERLSGEFGKGFTINNLRNMRQFFQIFPNRYALRSELTWTHYRILMRVNEQDRREFYLKESVDSGWTSRQLERQINSFYYERLLATQQNEQGSVNNLIQNIGSKSNVNLILKDPYVLEFLDLGENKSYHESELEQALINKLQEFMLELGKGFSFVSRQKRITTEDSEHYYIDLVFYNYYLKCFIIIDLKTGKLNFQDVGQIDFYVRLFDEKVKMPDDNPTIGIVLCTDKDASIVKYSVLADNANLFASKYRLYLPTESELKAELERQRDLIEREMTEDN